MSQKAPGRAVKRELQRAKAIELRSLGLSYARIAEALGVHKTRAFNIVRDALNEVQQENRENAERMRTLELYRLDRITFALWPKRGDPRVAGALVRIIERQCKLYGLDGLANHELAGADGGPVEAKYTTGPDLSKLTLEEKLQLEALERKMRGEHRATEAVIASRESSGVTAAVTRQLEPVATAPAAPSIAAPAAPAPAPAEKLKLPSDSVMSAARQLDALMRFGA